MKQKLKLLICCILGHQWKGGVLVGHDMTGFPTQGDRCKRCDEINAYW